MSTLANMPKSKETKRTEVHLMPDKHEQLVQLAKQHDWSVKKMTEKIVLWYLEEQDKKKGGKK